MGSEKESRVSEVLPNDYPSRKMRNMTKQDRHVFHGIYFKIVPVDGTGALTILIVSRAMGIENPRISVKASAVFFALIFLPRYVHRSENLFGLRCF
jgi:hypothetical protein